MRKGKIKETVFIKANQIATVNSPNSVTLSEWFRSCQNLNQNWISWTITWILSLQYTFCGSFLLCEQCLIYFTPVFALFYFSFNFIHFSFVFNEFLDRIIKMKFSYNRNVLGLFYFLSFLIQFAYLTGLHELF